VGLGSVDNTADANKSVKYATSAGSASSATKATQDSSSQTITSTYIKGLSVSGKTITYTRGDNTTGTITTQDTNTTYSVGTSTYSGTTKLYTTTGSNTDGTMTQKVIKEALTSTGNFVLEPIYWSTYFNNYTIIGNRCYFNLGFINGLNPLKSGTVVAKNIPTPANTNNNQICLVVGADTMQYTVGCMNFLKDSRELIFTSNNVITVEFQALIYVTGSYLIDSH